MKTLDIDTAHSIAKYFFHKYRDFWNFRGCNYYQPRGSHCWCLKKDGVTLAISRDYLTVSRPDYCGVNRFEIYKVPDVYKDG